LGYSGASSNATLPQIIEHEMAAPGPLEILHQVWHKLRRAQITFETTSRAIFDSKGETMNLHPWHSVSLGKNSPEYVRAIIEIPKGSKQKYEIDKESGLLMLDRVMSSAVFYPANYGFLPQTYCDDKDPLDIFVLGQDPVYPMSIMNARVVGAMKMIDGGEGDDKILAVHADDPQYKHIETLEQVNPHVLREIEQFFRTYKALETKVVEVKNWVSKSEALQIVRDSIALYEKEKANLIR
jgi:inorganic pyrophosphatase